MDSAKEMFLVCVTKIDPSKLPAGNGLSLLPDSLDAALTRNCPGVVDPLYFMVPSERSDAVLRYVDARSVNYHQYAVEVFGEKCILDCPEHRELATVIPITKAHKRR